MTGLVIAVLLASLAGSLHCAGMCGPLVAVYAGDDPARGWRRSITHGCYSVSRLAAYALLGAAAGSIGAALDLAGELAGVQRVTAVAAGLFIAAWGVLTLLRLRGLSVRAPAMSLPLRGIFSRLLGGLRERPPVARAALLGVASALLPCGWLWGFVVIAAGSGGAAGGALVMSAFWLGTLPVMLAVGVGLQALAGPLRRHVPAICAVLMIVAGLSAVVFRADRITRATRGRHAPASVEQALDQVRQLSGQEPPCCEP